MRLTFFALSRFLLLALILGAFVILPNAACCSRFCGKGPQAVPPTTCPEEEPAKPKDPLEGSTVKDGLTPEKRIEFISEHIDAVVYVHINRYQKDRGITFSSGTGVVIDDDYIITAYHVVKDAEFVKVTLRHLKDDRLTIENDEIIPVLVVRVDKTNDVALLQRKYVEDELPDPMPMNPDWVPKKKTLVWHFGQKTSWQKGYVTDPETDHSTVKGVVETNAQADYGDSGGPFVTADGKLVGILLSIRKGEGKSFFVPLGKVLRGLEYDLPEDE